MKDTTDFNPESTSEANQPWNAATPESYFASQPDKEDDSDQDEDEEESSDKDWGTVDPQEHPGPPSDMDPTAPGSAV